MQHEREAKPNTLAPRLASLSTPAHDLGDEVLHYSDIRSDSDYARSGATVARAGLGNPWVSDETSVHGPEQVVVKLVAAVALWATEVCLKGHAADADPSDGTGGLTYD